MAHNGTDDSRGRTRLVFVVNTLTPYRVHTHLRVRHELPGVEMLTYVTWDVTRNPWIFKDPPDIGVVTFPEAVPESSMGTLDYYVGDYRTGGRIIERLKRDRPDAVVCCGYGYPSMFRVILWCHRHGVPLVLWGDSNAHADTARGLRRAVKGVLLPKIARRCRAILVCGRNGQRYWARYGVEVDKLFFSPIEPNYAQIDAAPQRLVDELAQRFNLCPGRRRFMLCARLVPVKAVDQAIDAFVAIARRRPEVDLLIVGDGPLRRLLQARVPSTLSDRVIFTGFFDNQDCVNAFYRLSDVFVHPATWEPWGVVLLEATAAGLAVITTSVVGAVPEVAHDGVNAIIIRPNDRLALAEAMLRVTEPDRLASMKAASKVVSRAFRENLDPVKGIRDALRYAGVNI
jgi:glycosyltransferase involved in cell wall biosynthesis